MKINFIILVLNLVYVISYLRKRKPDNDIHTIEGMDETISDKNYYKEFGLKFKLQNEILNFWNKIQELMHKVNHESFISTEDKMKLEELNHEKKFFEQEYIIRKIEELKNYLKNQEDKKKQKELKAFENDLEIIKKDNSIFDDNLSTFIKQHSGKFIRSN